MKLSKRPPLPIDESYDEHEARHRFESAVRGARFAHEQKMKAVPRAQDGERMSVSLGGSFPSMPERQ
jgi:hypothetical protein